MSSTKDKCNLILAESQEAADRTNREFYGRFNYPWPPLTFPVVSDLDCGTVFLNQDLGDWTHTRIPRAPRIWVAGCGTNQAVFTALRFPHADVVGTDISAQSLAFCQQSASQLGIKNLSLEERSLNDVNCDDEFDYVICTGVLHHNADPGVLLSRLSRALKPGGIMEIMVYNYFHRILTTAYQKAIRGLFNGDPLASLETQLSATKRLIDSFPLMNTMNSFLKANKGIPDAALADALLQPVEHSYTVESMGELLQNAGLEFWLPCLNQFDKDSGRLTWNIAWKDETVARQYGALPDVTRWQITNLLSIEKSPMLWFYAQRKESSFKRRSEDEVGQDFLNTRFERYSTTVNHYNGRDGTYQFVPKPAPYPSPRVPHSESARRIFEAVDSKSTVREILQSLNIEPTFDLVNTVRIQLATPLFPYLKAIAG
jgi:SAM-dependent methyltransferase